MFEKKNMLGASFHWKSDVCQYTILIHNSAFPTWDEMPQKYSKL